MLLTLGQVRKNLEAKLVDTLGADAAVRFADAFVAAVIGHRREIEAAGTTPPGGSLN